MREREREQSGSYNNNLPLDHVHLCTVTSGCVQCTCAM